MKTSTILRPLVVLALLLPGLAHAETRRFEEPMQERFRLDYCRFVGVDCGIAAAFDWCQQEGYTQIEHFHGERDLDNTQRIGDGAICREDLGQTCDGFEFITCSREGPPPGIIIGDEEFERPTRPYTGRRDDDASAGSNEGTSEGTSD